MPKYASLIRSGMKCMDGGVDAVTGSGPVLTFTFGGSLVAGDNWTVLLNNSGTINQIGSGFITGESATFCFTYGNKEYVFVGPTVFCSAQGDPTNWNDPDSVGGNGFVKMTNYFGTPEDLVGMASFQGRLAFFSRQTTQIWQVAPDVADWQQLQVIQNVGAVRAQTIQAIGELDVIFLSDSGVRSLRNRSQTLNAYVDDLGSPIDSLVIASMLSSGFSTSISIVEPTAMRYWLYLNGTIYVLSRFLSSKVTAWSKYTPQYEQNYGTPVLTTFVPKKFGIVNGKVYIWITEGSGPSRVDKVLCFGGTTGAFYDSSVANIETPYLDFKTPASRKVFQNLNVFCSGAWSITAGTDPISGIMNDGAIYANTGPSSDIGMVSFTAQGTHLKLKAVTSGSTAAVLSAYGVHYEVGEEV